MNGFVLAGVAIAAFAAGAALVSFRYERELRRLARFLDQREPTGNARMTAFVRTRGVLGIARGVNAELDELQDERIASQQARQAFRAGLTCLSHDIRTPLAGAQGYLQLAEGEADPAAIDIDRLFERFYQGGGARSSAGAGLGLAIVSQLAASMGATAAASLEGGVLRVTVELQ